MSDWTKSQLEQNSAINALNKSMRELAERMDQFEEEALVDRDSKDDWLGKIVRRLKDLL